MKVSEICIGMQVRFHPIIGGNHDQNLYRVTALGVLHGQEVAWLEGKAGCVDLRALSVPVGLSCPRRPGVEKP